VIINKILQQRRRTKLCKTYDKLTTTLQVSGKMTYHFPKKILGSRISLTYKTLMKILRWTSEKSYKILRSFKNRASG